MVAAIVPRSSGSTDAATELVFQVPTMKEEPTQQDRREHLLGFASVFSAHGATASSSASNAAGGGCSGGGGGGGNRGPNKPVQRMEGKLEIAAQPPSCGCAVMW